MDLTFTEQEEAFRAEARAWLEANVPRPPLPSGDTREGFALHKEWERALFDAETAKSEGRQPRSYHGVFASHPLYVATPEVLALYGLDSSWAAADTDPQETS